MKRRIWTVLISVACLYAAGLILTACGEKEPPPMPNTPGNEDAPTNTGG